MYNADNLDSTQRRSYIKNLIHLYATKFEKLSGKKFEIVYDGQCMVNLKTGVIHLPDVVNFGDEDERLEKVAMLLFGARHEFGHLMSTDIDILEKWVNKVHLNRHKSLLAFIMNVFEDIREEHHFCKMFPGAIRDMHAFNVKYVKPDMINRAAGKTKLPLVRVVANMIYYNARMKQYRSYGLSDESIEAPPGEIKETYDRMAADLCEQAVTEETQEGIYELAYEYYKRMKEMAEDAPKAPPLAVGDVVRKGKEYGHVKGIDGFEVDVEIITKAEAKKILKDKGA